MIVKKIFLIPLTFISFILFLFILPLLQSYFSKDILTAPEEVTIPIWWDKKTLADKGEGPNYERHFYNIKNGYSNLFSLLEKDKNFKINYDNFTLLSIFAPKHPGCKPEWIKSNSNLVWKWYNASKPTTIISGNLKKIPITHGRNLFYLELKCKNGSI